MFDFVRYYLLRVSHDEVEEETVVVHNTSDHSLVPILVHFFELLLVTSPPTQVLGSPLWGSLYGAELTCWQNDLPLACGSLSLVATPSLSPACRAHSSFCQDEEKVENKMVVKLIFVSTRWFSSLRRLLWRPVVPTPQWNYSGKNLEVVEQISTTTCNIITTVKIITTTTNITITTMSRWLASSITTTSC